MTTRWAKRGQALRDQKPRLTVRSPPGPRTPGHPVPRGARGTEFTERNPMHDREPLTQEEGAREPIRPGLRLKGVR